MVFYRIQHKNEWNEIILALASKPNYTQENNNMNAKSDT